MSIRATVRITGVSKPTILKLLRDLGTACALCHEKHVRGLRPERVQTDEIWSFNYSKERNVGEAKVAPVDAGDVWTWTALDSGSKLIIAYQVERHNLTIRMGMRRFTRLADAHNKKIENHWCAVALFFMFYNFARVHSTIGTRPAVKAGLADHVWTLEELIGLLD